MDFKDYKYICKINTVVLETEFGKLVTDELIITDERDEHIRKRHKDDYIIFHQHVLDVIQIPDVILKDSKNQNTVFYIKYIEETNLNIVVRLSLETEGTGKINSVITSYRLGKKTLKRLKKNNKILYNRE